MEDLENVEVSQKDKDAFANITKDLQIIGDTIERIDDNLFILSDSELLFSKLIGAIIFIHINQMRQAYSKLAPFINKILDGPVTLDDIKEFLPDVAKFMTELENDD